MWWYTAILACGRLRKVDYELEFSQGYSVSLKPARATRVKSYINKTKYMNMEYGRGQWRRKMIKAKV